MSHNKEQKANSSTSQNIMPNLQHVPAYQTQSLPRMYGSDVCFNNVQYAQFPGAILQIYKLILSYYLPNTLQKPKHASLFEERKESQFPSPYSMITNCLTAILQLINLKRTTGLKRETTYNNKTKLEA